MRYRDQITPWLARLARRAGQMRPVLEAAGAQLAALAARSFNEPGVRAAPWAPLKPGTIAAKLKAGKSTAILKRDVVLARSWRVVEVDDRSVTVGTDRPYAAYLQFGTRRGIPPRPMLPFIGAASAARLAPEAQARIQRIARRKLEALPGR